MKTIVKHFNYRGHKYVIVYDRGHYMTIEDKYIDKSGKINKELHYFDGLHTANTLKACIEDTKNDLDIRYYIDKGMSKAEAFCTVFGILDKMSEIEKIMA